jgi:hypothetical protein
LIQKALDRDGPDNITVVLARFQGEGLPAPTAEDQVSFIPYDPGPGAFSDAAPDLAAFDQPPPGATVNERVPKELMSADEVITASVVEKPDRSEPSSGSTANTARSVLAFFFLALVAAAAGGIFVMKCERDQAARSEGRSSGP